MKLVDLLAQLHDLPTEDLNKQVFVHTNSFTFEDMEVKAITVSCDDPTVVGYIITEKEKQLELDFAKDVN